MGDSATDEGGNHVDVRGRLSIGCYCARELRRTPEGEHAPTARRLLRGPLRQPGESEELRRAEDEALPAQTQRAPPPSR